MTMPILKFTGDYRWLSNFIGGVEQCYQAAKSNDPEKQKAILKMTAADAKKAGRRIKLHHTWERDKDTIMMTFLREKFQREPFRSQLIATKDAYIEEGNCWGDVYWGVDIRTRRGLNKLGHLIMMIRSELSLPKGKK